MGTWNTLLDESIEMVLLQVIGLDLNVGFLLSHVQRDTVKTFVFYTIQIDWMYDT